ncbi:hypothetical protein ACROYT_G019129 [Oculina patagonica]
MKLVDNTIRSFRVAKVFRENSDRINHIDFSPNGETLITSSDDDSIVIYDCLEGKPKRTLYSKKYGVAQIQYTHATNTVIHTSTKIDDTVRYLSLHDNKYLRYFTGHTKRVLTLHMSPMDDTFVSGSLDRTLRLWDLRSPNCQGLMHVNGRPVAAFDPEGLIFAAGVDSEMVKLYDLRSFDKIKYEREICMGVYNGEPIGEPFDAVFTHARSTRTRRGSAVVSMPGDHYQMDLHVLNVQREPMEGKTLSVIREKKELSGSSTSLNSIDPEKRSRWSILRRNKKMLLLKDKPRQGEDFKESLARMRENPRAIVEHELSEFKNSHWTQLMGQSMERSPRRPRSESTLSDHETKRREAVWELFHSEVVYLMSHLLVLKEVFLEPLKEIQQMGHLQHVDANKIFCNLQDLCEVSTRFAKNLLRVFQNEQPTQFGSTASVVSAFTEFSRKVHPQYQKYCLNYSKALSYLDSLKKDEDFQEFMKWCESNSRCNRLQITDLLVAPLQHLTKYPLLLKNIRKRTAEGDEQHSSLSSIIKAVELSIQELEGKVKSRANYERLQELQSSLVWPSITELDPKTYVPEFLRGILLKQPCESLLASPKRQLLYEGPLTLMENAKVDVYAFLFDDMLLLTRFRKLPQKVNKHPSLVQKLNLTGMTDSPPSTPPVVRRSMSGAQYTVYKQPIPLDRFIIIDAEATHAGSTLKNSFIIIHYSRFKQTVGLYTLQAPSQNLKETWTSTLKAAQSKWSEAVALELAAETEKMSAFQNINEGEVEQDTDPKSPDDTVMSQTQMLSYYKPIESQC